MTTDTIDANTVAQYLIDHPQFFEQHAGLLGEVKLSSPLTGRAVSLQERQMEVMRDKYRVLELRLAELTRRAEENHAIANRFHAWNQALLASRGDAAMPRDLVDALHCLMRLKLDNNLRQIAGGRAPDNAVRLAELGTLERQALKDSLTIVRSFRQWLGLHFRLDAL